MGWRRMWFLGLSLAFIAVLVFPSSSQAVEKVTVRLDWSYWGGHAPFFVAIEKGFFARRGLDAVVQDGKGSRITAMLVGQGKDDFGHADASSVAAAISQGLSAKVIAIIMPKNPNGIVYLEGTPIESPKDLEGKIIGTSPGGSDATFLEGFLTRNNVDVGKVRLEKMPGDAKPAALLAGKVDGISAQGFYNMPILEAQGAKPRQLLYADYGLPGVNYGIFASTNLIQERPDTVRRFVPAILEAWEYAIAHKDEAIAILSKHVPLLDATVARRQFQNMQQLLHTKNTENKSLGWQSEEDWKETLDALEQYGGMSRRLPVEEYFTNEFIEVKR
jgi:NitT/TauT family transport system substrate-binding protein